MNPKNPSVSDMQIIPIETGTLRLDGGAMFGVVPKQIWGRQLPTDEVNRVTWAMRCLLVIHGQRRILVDTGVGQKQDQRFQQHFAPANQELLLNNLAAHGLGPTDITDVLLTHLHFDHVGGAIFRNAAGELQPTFPQAIYWSNAVHYAWATQPNPREAASFLSENFLSLRDWGQLQFVDPQTAEGAEWLPGIQLRWVYGHTEAMMLPIFTHAGATAVYCADLLPSSFHLGLPYVMAYDVRPLLTMEEKQRLLAEALAAEYTLIFEHDPQLAMGKLQQSEQGRLEVVPVLEAFWGASPPGD